MKDDLEMLARIGDIQISFNNNLFSVSLSYVEVKQGKRLIGVTGRGNTIKDAARDYINKIVGHTLVKNAMNETIRREFVVLDLGMKLPI